MVVMLYTFCSFLSCLGDPAKLHIQIRDFDVDMQSLEELSLQELRALCEKSDIPVTSSKSQISPVMNTFIFVCVCEYILHISIVITCRPIFHLFHVLQ